MEDRVSYAYAYAYDEWRRMPASLRELKLVFSLIHHTILGLTATKTHRT